MGISSNTLRACSTHHTQYTQELVFQIAATFRQCGYCTKHWRIFKDEQRDFDGWQDTRKEMRELAWLDEDWWALMPRWVVNWLERELISASFTWWRLNGIAHHHISFLSSPPKTLCREEAQFWRSRWPVVKEKKTSTNYLIQIFIF